MDTAIEDWIGTAVERSFTAEPPTRDPRDYAVQGRRAQRHRRTAVGGVGLVGLVAVTTLVLGGTDRTAPDRGVEPAGTEVIPVRVTEPVPVDPRQPERCEAGRVGACDDDISTDDIHLDRTGRLLRGYAYDVVTGYYADVLPDESDPDVTLDSSAAVELTVRGRTVWALLRLDVGGSSSLQYAAPDPTRTFDEWVHESAASGLWFSYRHDPDGPGEGSTPR